MQTPDSPPERLDAAIVITQMGGLGDLVLTSQIVTAMRSADATRPVILVCRRSTASIVDCFPVAPDCVIAVDCDPERWQGTESTVFEEAAAVRAALTGITAEQVIAA